MGSNGSGSGSGSCRHNHTRACLLPRMLQLAGVRVCVCLGLVTGFHLPHTPRGTCNVSAFKAPPKLFSGGKTLDVLMLFTGPTYNAVNGSDNAFKRCPPYVAPAGCKWQEASGNWQRVNW